MSHTFYYQAQFDKQTKIQGDVLLNTIAVQLNAIMCLSWKYLFVLMKLIPF